jgi:transposase InsO family protein
MNIIDDFSSFVWSLPLRSKSDAFSVLKHWVTAVELHTAHKLKCIVTDNGELTSNQMRSFCAEKGILHLLTAPYTSAHNGRAERLHRTLMDKAHAMRLACSAPSNMWDEFCATAAYLTNLTGSSANDGKTPYELWHSKLPSLSHLQEIGCRAYALIPTSNPKVLHRSLPCILIGYGQNSKAYRLWDPATNNIFNSFHVSFIEQRELPPKPSSTLSQAPPPKPAQPEQLQLPPNPSTPERIIPSQLTFLPPPGINIPYYPPAFKYYCTFFIYFSFFFARRRPSPF